MLMIALPNSNWSSPARSRRRWFRRSRIPSPGSAASQAGGRRGLGEAHVLAWWSCDKAQPVGSLSVMWPATMARRRVRTRRRRTTCGRRDEQRPAVQRPAVARRVVGHHQSPRAVHGRAAPAHKGGQRFFRRNVPTKGAVPPVMEAAAPNRRRSARVGATGAVAMPVPPLSVLSSTTVPSGAMRLRSRSASRAWVMKSETATWATGWRCRRL